MNLLAGRLVEFSIAAHLTDEKIFFQRTIFLSQDLLVNFHRLQHQIYSITDSVDAFLGYGFLLCRFRIFQLAELTDETLWPDPMILDAKNRYHWDARWESVGV